MAMNASEMKAGAAQNQANSGALLVEYGDKPEAGLRDLENALAVSRKLGIRTSRGSAWQVIAAYYRMPVAMRKPSATFNEAIAISRNGTSRTTSLCSRST